MTRPIPSPHLKSRILARAGEQPGAVWAPVDFLDLGSRAAVDKALQRLAAAGHLGRIDRGLYAKPRINNLTGKPTAPDTRAVIDAVARRDQARLVIDGLTAANDLGLTTAVPASVIVLTDARLRPIHLGNQVIMFKQAAPSRLYWARRPAMRVVQALHWLQDVLPSDRDRILGRLRSALADPQQGRAIRDDLRDGLRTLPTWMQSPVHEILRDDRARTQHHHHGDDATAVDAAADDDDVGDHGNRRNRQRRIGPQSGRTGQ